MTKTINKVLIFFLVCSFSFSESFTIRNPFVKPSVFGLKAKQLQEKQIEKGKELSLENLNLTGIINGEIALINHRFVKKDDKLGVFTVKEISENKVKLFADGKTYELILNLRKLKNEK
jgi:phage protein U